MIEHVKFNNIWYTWFI